MILETTALTSLAPFRSSLDASPEQLLPHVTGEVPAWLHGDLIRTAPAVFERAQFAAGHWFDGLGMLYAFGFAKGQVTYRQRLMETAIERETRTGKATRAAFGTPLERGLWKRLFEPVAPVTDNANVNVIALGDALVALSELPHQWAFDRASLAVTQTLRYEDALGDVIMIAHPHYDAARGKVVNVALKMGRKTEIQVYEHDPKERQRALVGSLAVDRLPYIHSFGLTPKHAILIGHPLDLSAASMLWSNRGFSDHMTFRPNAGTRFWLMDRQTGSVREHHAPSGFVFHTVNAFERGSETVLDVALYPDASVMRRFSREALLADGLPALAPSIVRYTFQPGREAAHVEVLLGRGFEFPSINYRTSSGKAHGHVWGAQIEKDGRSAIVKLEANGNVLVVQEQAVTFGEPIFVPHPEATSEDEGVLLTVGTAPDAAKSELRILDACTLQTMASVQVNVPIPLGFHGNFFRTKEVNQA